MTDLSTFDFCKLHKELKEYFKGESPKFSQLLSVIYNINENIDDAHEIVRVMEDIELIKIRKFRFCHQCDFIMSIL